MKNEWTEQDLRRFAEEAKPAFEEVTLAEADQERVRNWQDDGLMVNYVLRNGQVATQYVDLTGMPTMDQRFNPNGSVLAIEGITSPDGRVFGKMGHSERSGEYLYKNVTGDKYQPIFEGGVDYFKV